MSSSYPLFQNPSRCSGAHSRSVTLLVYSHQYALPLLLCCSEVLYSSWERKLVNLLSSDCSVSALQLFESSGATCSSSHSSVLTRLYLNQEMAPQTPEFPPFLLWETPHTFARLLPFTKVYKEPESFLTSFFISGWLRERCQSVCSMQLVQRERRGWHFPLSHFDSFAVSNFTFSFNIFLLFPLKLGVMTLWQPDKKKARSEVEMWGSCQKGKSRGSLWGMSLCLCMCIPLCVWKLLKFGMYSVSDRQWVREVTWRIYKWLHGITDGLIAKAPLIVINDLKIAYNPMFVLSKSFPN